MNAQEQWLREYEEYKCLLSRGARNNQREIMRKYRREAALERIIACQQREIDSQANQLEELGKAYERMRDTVMDLTL